MYQDQDLVSNFRLSSATYVRGKLYLSQQSNRIRQKKVFEKTGSKADMLGVSDTLEVHSPPKASVVSTT